MKQKFSWNTFKKNFKRDWQLHLMAIIPVVYVIIFNFVPLYGEQIAFRDFRPKHGITGSEWVGLQWFEKFLTSPDFGRMFMNTLILSLYSMSIFPLPVIFALVLNALRQEKYKKVVQTVSYMPHFISITVLVGILFTLLNPTSGMYGNIYTLITGAKQAPDIRYMSSTFRHFYVWSGVWQDLGWDSIIYVAALSSVSQELHEAAQIDGATRLKRMWYVDIPTITPTICILLIMRCTSIISVGAEKALLMQRPRNLSVSEVLSTYVYKTTQSGRMREFSYASAIGLFNAVINITLLVLVNTIVKKATDGEVSLY